jgi:phosphoribosylaminoimidazole carboxylase
MEACFTDQFEQHLRCIAGLPVGDTAMRVPASLMMNVLGDPSTSAGVDARSSQARQALTNSMFVPGASAHWYGKAQERPGRKMAHVTVVSARGFAALHQAIESATKPLDLSADALKALQAAAAADSEPSCGGAEAVEVGIIMGSDSDLPTMAAAAKVLQDFGVSHEVTVVSAHRTPDRMYAYAKGARARGMRVMSAGAGGAAHLPGMVAALTPLPVIGVPVKGSYGGNDSLLSIVQMPRGVPVATVAIGNAMNAGLLAVRMLGGSYIPRMQQFMDQQEADVLQKAAKMEELGVSAYLASMK